MFFSELLQYLFYICSKSSNYMYHYIITYSSAALVLRTSDSWWSEEVTKLKQIDSVHSETLVSWWI